MWPFGGKREPEQRSYTSRVIAESTAAAEGPSAETPLTTAALEAAAGLYSACFAAARLDPEVPALSPSVRALVARNLIRLGQDYHQIEMRDGGLVLVPVGYAYPYSQSPDPMVWLYQSSVYTPSGSRHQWIHGAAMLHCRYAVDPERPWIGIPPWRWASTSGALAGSLEKRIGEESAAPVGHLLPVPADGGDGGDDDPLASLKGDMAAAKGRSMLVETTSAGWAEGKAAAPQSDFKQQRFGGLIPETSVSLRSDAAQAVLSACGVPGALVDSGADGTAQREAWRRFAMGPLAGMAALVEEEIAKKLDVQVRFDFRALWAHDLAGRASSFKALITGGMEVERAAALSGLMTDEDR